MLLIKVIESGAELNLIWDFRSLNHQTTLFISISNFIDPYESFGAINCERLVENGMFDMSLNKLEFLSSFKISFSDATEVFGLGHVLIFHETISSHESNILTQLQISYKYLS